MLRPTLALLLVASIGGASAQTTYDARILDYTGLRYVCEGSGTPVLKIQNAGTATMGTCVVETWKNGLLVNTFNWILAVPAFQGDVRQPVLPVVPDLEPADVLEFRIISVNDQPDEDPDGNTLSVPMDVVPANAGTYLVQVQLSMSALPDQLVWYVTNINGQVVAQGGPYASVQQVEAWVELMPDACYMVRCDEMGLKPTASAQLSIRSNGAEVIALPSGTATEPARAGLVTGMVLNADAVGRSALRISPNPAADAVRVSSGGFGNRWRIVDGQGRLVMEEEAATTGEDSVIDVSGLKPGLYILELEGDSASRARLVIQR